MAGRFLVILWPGRRWVRQITVCSGLSGGGDRTEFSFGGGDTREEVGVAAFQRTTSAGEAG